MERSDVTKASRVETDGCYTRRHHGGAFAACVTQEATDHFVPLWYLTSGCAWAADSPTHCEQHLTCDSRSPILCIGTAETAPTAEGDGNMVRAIIYPRVSTANQKDGASLEMQEEDCRAHAVKQGYE